VSFVRDSKNASHLNMLLSMPWKHIEEQIIASRIFITAEGISLVSLMLQPIYSRIEPGYPFAYDAVCTCGQ
jgi:hypothetical protein